jgi:alpha-D-xyloside xylohydrolase
MSMPLLARPGSIIPFGAVDSRPDYDYAEGLTFHVFEPVEGEEAFASVADLGGAAVLSCRALLRGKRLSIKVEGAQGRYGIMIRGRSVRAISGDGEAESGELGSIVRAEAGEELVVDLD